MPEEAPPPWKILGGLQNFRGGVQYDAGGLFQARGLVRFYRFTPPLDGPEITIYLILFN